MHTKRPRRVPQYKAKRLSREQYDSMRRLMDAAARSVSELIRTRPDIFGRQLQETVH